MAVLLHLVCSGCQAVTGKGNTSRKKISFLRIHAQKDLTMANVDLNLDGTLMVH